MGCSCMVRLRGLTAPAAKKVVVNEALPWWPCLLCCAGVPIFFVYLKSPDRFHSDALAVIFIIIVWTLGG